MSASPVKVSTSAWPEGVAPVAVVMIALNEGHNIEAILDNLSGWAKEVFLVDSFSKDETVDIALRYGVTVVQRRFRDFGDQWSFALRELPIKAEWTLKLDPDERLTDELKREIIAACRDADENAFSLRVRLFFMGKALPVRLRLLRLWRTGRGRVSEVPANEHIFVDGSIGLLQGDVEHRDSPDLDHWLEKQNRYTTAEAVIAHQGTPLADRPDLFGTPLQRRMWLKANFHRLPGRYLLLFLYYLLIEGTWRAGWVGFAWARLRSDVMRFRDYKSREMEITGRVPARRHYGAGVPDERVRQYD